LSLRARFAGKPYRELGAGYFASLEDPERETRRLIAKLRPLGHTIIRISLGTVISVVCAARRCRSEWRWETFAAGLSQQVSVAEGSLIRVVLLRWGAVRTRW
jgi:hypothetical protein